MCPFSGVQFKRQAKEEAERQAKEEAERQAKEEADRKAAEEAASREEESAVAETPVEKTAEEPAADEPAAEEPAAEKPAAEEPAVEEPAAEETTEVETPDEPAEEPAEVEAEETPAPTEAPTVEPTEEPTPEPTEEPLSLEDLTASASDVALGENIQFSFVATGADRVTWSAERTDGEIGATGLAEYGSFNWTPGLSGIFTVTVVASRGDEQVSAETVVTVREGELTAAASIDALYAFANEDTLSYNIAVSGGVQPVATVAEIRVDDGAARTFEAQGDTFEYKPTEFGIHTLTLTATDATGAVATASASVPVAVNEREDWEATLPRLTGDMTFAEKLVAVAKSQRGYAESERNFIIDENHEKHAYTRYGDWYGRPYEAWNGMFASFCLNYARIPQKAMPQGFDAQDIRKALGSRFVSSDGYQPEAGDLVFLRHDGEAVGIVVDANESGIHAVIGDWDGEAVEKGFGLNDGDILGYASMKAAMAAYDPAYVAPVKTEFHYADDRVIIDAVALEGANLPEDAELHAEYMAPGSAAYEAAVASLLAEFEVPEGQTAEFVLYDIYFTANDGRIEPEDGGVRVSMTFVQPVAVTEENEEIVDAKVVHVADDGSAEQRDGDVQINENGEVEGLDFFGETFSPNGAMMLKGPIRLLMARAEDGIYDLTGNAKDWVDTAKAHLWVEDTDGHLVDITDGMEIPEYSLYELYVPFKVPAASEFEGLQPDDVIRYPVPEWIRSMNLSSGSVEVDGQPVGTFEVKDGYYDIKFSNETINQFPNGLEGAVKLNGRVEANTTTTEGSQIVFNFLGHDYSTTTVARTVGIRNIDLKKEYLGDTRGDSVGKQITSVQYRITVKAGSFDTTKDQNNADVSSIEIKDSFEIREKYAEMNAATYNIADWLKEYITYGNVQFRILGPDGTLVNDGRKVTWNDADLTNDDAALTLYFKNADGSDAALHPDEQIVIEYDANINKEIYQHNPYGPSGNDSEIKTPITGDSTNSQAKGYTDQNLSWVNREATNKAVVDTDTNGDKLHQEVTSEDSKGNEKKLEFKKHWLYKAPVVDTGEGTNHTTEWEISLNEGDGMDIGNWTLEDDLAGYKQKIISDVIVKADGAQVDSISLSDLKAGNASGNWAGSTQTHLAYKFPTGANQNYRFFFTAQNTDVAGTQGECTNGAVLREAGDDGDTYGVYKSYSGKAATVTKRSDGLNVSTGKANWVTTIDEGIDVAEGSVYYDYLGWELYEGSTKTNGATVSVVGDGQIDHTVDLDSIKIYYGEDKTLMTSGYTVDELTDTEIEKGYKDKDEWSYSKGFKVTFSQAYTGPVILEYSTTANLADVAKKERFRNYCAYVKDPTSDDAPMYGESGVDYEVAGAIKKQVEYAGWTDKNGTVDGNPTNETPIIKWHLTVNEGGKYQANSLVIKDTIPKGLEFDPAKDVQFRWISTKDGPDWTSYDAWRNAAGIPNAPTDSWPAWEITNLDNEYFKIEYVGRELTITLKKGIDKRQVEFNIYTQPTLEELKKLESPSVENLHYYNRADLYSGSTTQVTKSMGYSDAHAYISYKPVTKNYTYNESTAPKVKYTIEVNPGAAKLSDDGKVTLIDEAPANSSVTFILPSSLHVYNGDGVELTVLTADQEMTAGTCRLTINGSSVETGNSFDLELPDETALTVVYEAHVPGIDGDTVNLGNTAKLKVGNEVAFSEEITTETDFVVTSVTARFPNLILVRKVDSRNKDLPLPGTVFTVYPLAENDFATWGDAVGTITIGEDGIGTSYNSFEIADFTAYELVETTAPENHVLPSDTSIGKFMFVTQSAPDDWDKEEGFKAFIDRFRAKAGAKIININTTDFMYFVMDEPATINLPVEKTWRGNGYTLPESVEVQLLANGEVVTGKTLTLMADANGEWKGTFENLPVVDDNGDAIEYTIQEVEPEGFVSEKTGVTSVTFDKTKTELFTIDSDTNEVTYIGGAFGLANTPKITVSGTKAWSYPAGTTVPTSVTVQLQSRVGTADYTDVSGKTQEVTGNAWTYSFADLPRFDENNKQIDYRVVESDVPEGFTEVRDDPVRGNDGNITSDLHNVKYTRSLAGVAWYDGNQDGLIGSGETKLRNVTVTLYKLNDSGEYVATGDTTVTDRDGAYSFTGLEPGKYRVEFDHEGYEVTEELAGTDAAVNSKASQLTGDADALTGAYIQDIELPTDAEIYQDTKKQDYAVIDNNNYHVPYQNAGFVWSPVKSETTPGANLTVKGGDTITYTIAYENPTTEAQTITITDTPDSQVTVDVESISDGGSYAPASRTVTWTLRNVAAGVKGEVSFSVTVNADAVQMVENTATVKIGDNPEQSTNRIVNPIPPVKTETQVVSGSETRTSNAADSAVKPGDVLTYTIAWVNYEDKNADVIVTDALDPNVEYVSATNDGAESNGTVTWTFVNQAPGASGTVSLTVRVKDVNGGTAIANQAGMTVGNESKIDTNTVKNYVPEEPTKDETDHDLKTGSTDTYAAVQPGEEITYTITAKNYKPEAASMTITDTLDANVEFVSASDGGTESDGTVTWNIDSVPANTEKTVTLVVKVKDTALTIANGDETIDNQATTKVGNDYEYDTNTVKNPVEYEFSRSLEGIVWLDKNYNGTSDDDGLLEGIPVTLYKKNTTTGEYEAVQKDDRDWTVETDANGHYAFTGLDAGTYRVVFDDDRLVTENNGTAAPDKSIASDDHDIAGIYLPSDSEIANDVAKRAQVLANDGNYNVPDQNMGLVDYSRSVEGKVWLDKNYDERFEADKNDTPLANIPVTLMKKVGENWVKVTEDAAGNAYDVKTGADGSYKFENVPEGGTYKVVFAEETRPVTKQNVVEGEVTAGTDLSIASAAHETPEFTLPSDSELDAARKNGTTDANYDSETGNYNVPNQNMGVVGYTRSLEGIAWLDKGFDDLYDSEKDELLPHITATLCDKDGNPILGDDGEPKYVTTTNDDGHYKFEDLPAGTYTVRFIDPEGRAVTNRENAELGEGKSVADKEYLTPAVTLPDDATIAANDTLRRQVEAAGGNYNQPNLDIGLVKYDRKITGKVWLDVDRDGISGEDDILQKGIPIKLIMVNEDGEEEDAGSTTTDENGEYTFTGVEPGDYRIEFDEARPVTVQNQDDDGNPEAAKDRSIADADHAITEIHMPTDEEIRDEVNLGHGTVDEDGLYTLPDQNMGVVPYTRSVDGIAWFDGDRDGLLDNGEERLENITVRLLDENGDEIDHTTTDENGHYIFEDVPAGEYTIEFVRDQDVTDKGQGEDDSINSKADREGSVARITGVTLPNDDEIDKLVRAGSDEVTDGNYHLPYQHAGFVWSPEKQELDPGAGVGVLPSDVIEYSVSYENPTTDPAKITITDPLDKQVTYEAGTLKRSVTGGSETALDDRFHVEGTITVVLNDVPAGEKGTVTFKVKVMDGAVNKVENQASVAINDNPAQETERIENPIAEKPVKKEVTPGAGESVKPGDSITYTITAKNYKPVPAKLTITDRLDANVEVVSADGGTESNGKVVWTFEDVPAGAEKTVTLVVKVQDSAYAIANDPEKTVDNTASAKVDNDSEYDTETVKNPVEVHYTRSLEGIAWLDKGFDDIYDSTKGDQLLSGITATLCDEKGNPIPGKVTTTDANGHYKFTDLPAGTYTVRFTDPEGRLVTVRKSAELGENKSVADDGCLTPAVTLPDDATIARDDTLRKQVEANGNNYNQPNLNIGLVKYSREITGKVWLDEDYDGEADDGDTPLEGITVKLVDEDGKPVVDKDGNEITAKTDKDGNYAFENVAPGDYKIVFEDDRPVTKQNDEPEKDKSIADKLHTVNDVHVPSDKELREGKLGHGTLDENGKYTLPDQNMGVVEYSRGISGIAFLDNDKNGEYGTGDTLMPREKVYLYRLDKDGNPEKTPVAQTTTDAKGFYSFLDLEPGNYGVLFGVDLDELAVTKLKDTDNGSKIDAKQWIKKLYLPTDAEIDASEAYRKALTPDGVYMIEHQNAGYTKVTKATASPSPSPTPTPSPTPYSGGGGSNVSVTPRPTIDITGTKTWVDDGNSHHTRPDSIEVQLLADGVPVDATPSWTKRGDTWSYTFAGQPEVTTAGLAISYTVRETPVENYRTSISGTAITNTLIEREPEDYVEISGTKSWSDNDNAAGTRPTSITVRLLRDGVEVESRNVTAGTDWKYSFGRLPADDGYGNVYTYEVREDGVTGYYASVNGFDITNRLLPSDAIKVNTPTDGNGNTPGNSRLVSAAERQRVNEIFAALSDEELEELFDLFGYGTPLMGILGTGDETPLYPFVFGGLGLAALLALLVIRRRRTGGSASK